MKISFFLYFLVLSPLIFSQNSLQYDVEGYSYKDILSTKNSIESSTIKDLIVVDKNFTIDCTDAKITEPIYMEVLKSIIISKLTL